MPSSEAQKKNHQIYVVTLSILLALFCFRVLAQLLQLCVDFSFLPAFDTWQSGAVPYKGLLISQILILVFYGWILRQFVLGRIRPGRKQGWIFFIIGLIYFLVMAVRLFVGLAGLSEHYWFHSYLPTLFHFVISGYLIVVGYYHLQTSARRS